MQLFLIIHVSLSSMCHNVSLIRFPTLDGISSHGYMKTETTCLKKKEEKKWAQISISKSLYLQSPFFTDARQSGSICIKQSIEEENEILFWCFSSAAVYNAVYPQDMYGFSALAFFLPEVINHKYCSLLPRTYKTQLDAAGPGELSVLLSLKGILGNT